MARTRKRLIAPRPWTHAEDEILNVLAEQGPKTARELCEAIGMRTDRRNSKHGVTSEAGHANAS
jgi:hypothetical protein